MIRNEVSCCDRAFVWIFSSIKQLIVNKEVEVIECIIECDHHHFWCLFSRNPIWSYCSGTPTITRSSWAITFARGRKFVCFCRLTGSHNRFDNLSCCFGCSFGCSFSCSFGCLLGSFFLSSSVCFLNLKDILFSMTSRVHEISLYPVSPKAKTLDLNWSDNRYPAGKITKK